MVILHPIAVVRVYAVPMDLAGSRFLQAFRYDQPRSLFVDKDAKATLNEGIDMLSRLLTIAGLLGWMVTRKP